MEKEKPISSDIDIEFRDIDDTSQFEESTAIEANLKALNF